MSDKNSGKITMLSMLDATIPLRVRSCFTCIHFNDETGLCRIFDKVVPPYFSIRHDSCNNISLISKLESEEMPF